MAQKKVVVVAPATEAGIIKGALPPGEFAVIREVPALTGDTALEIANTDVQLVVVSSNVPGFALQHVQSMTKGENPRVVIAFAQPFGDQFDMLSQMGTVAYKIPVRADAVREVADNFDTLLAQATKAFMGETQTLDEFAPPETAPTMGLGFGALVRTTPFVFWGLSGGVGKTTLARDVSALLAAVLGRRVLIVDADMSRGMVSTLYSPEVYQKSQVHHVAALANLRYASGKMPPLQEHVIPLPFPEGIQAAQQQGVLHLLAGLPTPDMAMMEGFTAENGEAGKRFVRDLVKAASSYEFLLFDIGPIIPVPLHLGALQAANIVFVISRPQRGDVIQLSRALNDLEQTAGVPRERMRLIVNMHTPHNMLKLEEIASTLSIAMITQIPALPAETMQKLANEGQTALGAWLQRRKDPELTNYLRSLVFVVEIMLPGSAAIIKERFPDLVVSQGKKGAAQKKKRRGLFRR